MDLEVLFRAKRIDNDEWVCWNIYGELCRLSGKRTRLAIKNGATTHYYDYIYQIRQLVDEKTICRYTGLTDKNGKKIFENDIAKHYNKIGVGEPDAYNIIKFEWQPTGCMFKAFWIEGNGYYFVGNESDCVYEVIGDVFDNSELLEVLS